MLNVNFILCVSALQWFFGVSFCHLIFLGPCLSFRPEREWLYWISQQMCVILALENKRHALGFWQAWKWYLHWLNYHRCLPGIHYFRLKLLHLSSAIWPISCFPTLFLYLYYLTEWQESENQRVIETWAFF